MHTWFTKGGEGGESGVAGANFDLRRDWLVLGHGAFLIRTRGQYLLDIFSGVRRAFIKLLEVVQ
jgi:hypothetical protein